MVFDRFWIYIKKNIYIYNCFEKVENVTLDFSSEKNISPEISSKKGNKEVSS